MDIEKEKQIADDLSAVLKEAKSMGCTEVKYFHHIPLENVEIVINALEKLQTIKEYIEPLRNYNTQNEHLERLKELTL